MIAIDILNNIVSCVFDNARYRDQFRGIGENESSEKIDCAKDQSFS